jgi:hypothetical protein
MAFMKSGGSLFPTQARLAWRLALYFTFGGAFFT